MRGKGKKPPKYRKHKPSGQAVVTLNGKDHYLGPWNSSVSKQSYDRLIGEWLTNDRRLPSETNHVISIAELCVEYWRFAQDYYVKDGRKTDELAGLKVALRLLRENYSRTLVTEFGPLALATLQSQLIEKGNCRRYLNQQIGRIKRMFKWGVARELVPVSVFQALLTVNGLRKGKSSARETAPVLPVEDEIIEKTLEFVSNETTRDMIRFQRLTGCRPGELFSMRPKDIDRSGGGHEGVWFYWPESHKMEHKGRHRVIVIGPQAQEIIAKYLLRDELTHCFLRKCGKPFKRYHYSQQINYACDRAFPPPSDLTEEETREWVKDKRWAPNRLRHSAATDIRREFGLETAQVVAGHSKADVTQIYAERDIAKAVKAMREVG